MSPPQILLVDDEPNILKALQRLLFEEDYEVHSAGSGEAGLEILQSQPVDLIISDYRMPGLTGIEFFRRARQIQPGAIRIILSGFAEINSLTEAINEGNIYKFIFKPWNDEDLKTTIKLALEQKLLLEENRSLTSELQDKNQQLEEFNRQLEQKVAERTQELQQHNRILNLSQEILEQVPVGVVGMGQDGVVVLMNSQARQHFFPGIGCEVETVLPPDLASACRNLVQTGQTSVSLPFEHFGYPYHARLSTLRSDEGGFGGVMLVLQPADQPALQPA
jgi:YesN/AraC family two-component response regulator